VLFVDLDNFKPVNDTYGHAVGDEVLRACAERLRSQLRGGDVVARLGGDEFIVLMTDLEKPEHAIATAERLCRALDEPLVVSGHEVRVSSSIGIALFPDHGAEFEALLKRADAAMYSAKARRRGTFQLADL
jgi:diguanylate cyclase (GGDEF)-like protein